MDKNLDRWRIGFSEFHLVGVFFLLQPPIPLKDDHYSVDGFHIFWLICTLKMGDLKGVFSLRRF